MILYGRLARYQAEIQRLAHKWGVSLADMQQRYEQPAAQDFAADDAYADCLYFHLLLSFHNRTNPCSSTNPSSASNSTPNS